MPSNPCTTERWTAQADDVDLTLTVVDLDAPMVRLDLDMTECATVSGDPATARVALTPADARLLARRLLGFAELAQWHTLVVA